MYGLTTDYYSEKGQQRIRDYYEKYLRKNSTPKSIRHKGIQEDLPVQGF